MKIQQKQKDSFDHILPNANLHQLLIDRPIAQFSFDGALIQVYCAKHLHSHQWNSPQLKQYVMHARQSYLRYGYVPLIDDFDIKSEIYITRASYSIKDGDLAYPVEEWLSMRFVPSDGNPRYTEDLLYCLCEDKPLIQWLSELNFEGTKKSSEHMIAISRICSIPPRKISHERYEKNFTPPKRLHYKAVSFALMNKIFLENRNSLLQHYNYMTGIFRDEFIDNVLTDRTPKGEIIPRFTFGYKMLGLTNVHALRLDRSAPVLYPYHFSNYFLQMNELHKVLADLYSKRYLTRKTFIHYMGTEAHPDKWIHDLDYFKKISPKLENMLTTIGPLYATSTTGEGLRAILDREVSDGPKLRIMDIATWQNSIDEYLYLKQII